MPERDRSHNPFDGVTDLFSELTRMREIGTRGREQPREEAPRTHASAWVPPTDIVAQGEDVLIRIELAGVAPEDVNLTFSHGILTVSGSRLTGLEDGEPVSFYVRERFYGEFRRSFTLPEGTVASSISAEFADGLVEVRVAGGATDSGTRIEVRNRSGEATTRTLG
jgi:HSP20 family protein